MILFEQTPSILQLVQLVRPILFRIPLPDLDIFIRGGQHFSLRGNLHGPRFTENREFIPGLPRYRRSFRRLSGYDVRRGERSPRLLGIRAAILRHLDRLRRYVQHCLYFESLRDLSRSLHTHKGSTQASIIRLRSEHYSLPHVPPSFVSSFFLSFFSFHFVSLVVVTQIRYGRWVTRRVAVAGIAVVWLLAGLISFVPISLGLHRANEPVVHDDVIEVRTI